MQVWKMTRVYAGVRLEMYANVPGCVSEPVHSRKSAGVCESTGRSAGVYENKQ
jgi:hypothetical protein